MIFSASFWYNKMSIPWHKTSKTQHFMNYWCFWFWKPGFLHFIRPEYSKRSRKIKENPWQIWENMFYGNLKLKTFEISETLAVHCEFSNSEFLNFWWLEMMNSWKWWKVEDEEYPAINFAGGISWKSWMNLVSIKKHETKFSQILYFWAR